MGQVRITLNGRGYDIACEDGQEEHVMRLANAMSERVNQLVAANGQVGEARLLLMAGLLMADDLHSERAKAAATVATTVKTVVKTTAAVEAAAAPAAEASVSISFSFSFFILILI